MLDMNEKSCWKRCDKPEKELHRKHSLIGEILYPQVKSLATEVPGRCDWPHGVGSDSAAGSVPDGIWNMTSINYRTRMYLS